MSKSLKALLFVAAIGCLAFLGYEFIVSQFRVSNITLIAPAEKGPSLSQGELKALEQPYTYLDRGRQSYVFVSQDQKYVLKFFDIRRYKKTTSKKLERLIAGYRLAFERDQDHSGLIFLQLKPNSSIDLKVDLTDRFGIKHVVNLGKMPFVVQFKATPTRQLVTTLLEKGDIDEVKTHLRQLIDMYVDEYQRGLYDRDHNVMYNTGFIEDKPVRIDVGRLRYSESYKAPQFYQEDLDKIVNERIDGWLQRHFPQYREEIVADLQRKLKALS